MHLPHTLVVKLILALVIGGLIGLERELRSKSAGFRTMILICLGATIFTMLSELIGRASNPDRIASNIVVGIGFLGAGVIFRNEKRIGGITTAASIWLTAALGMGIGSGHFEISILGCVFVVAVLFLFSFLDRFLDSLNQLREYTLTYSHGENQQQKYDELIKELKLNVLSRTFSKSGSAIKCTWILTGKEKKHQAFITRLLEDDTINNFDF